VWNGVCGEYKDVDESVMSVYRPELLQLISPYEPKNIYNAVVSTTHRPCSTPLKYFSASDINFC
jgi:hypothetical protein